MTIFPTKWRAKGRNKMGGGGFAPTSLYETAKHEDHENLQNCESDSNISKKTDIYIYL